MRGKGGWDVAGWGRRIVLGMALAGLVAGAGCPRTWAQLPMPGAAPAAPNPLTDSMATPGKVLLYKLEAEFAKDTAARGGAGFASWFADDGIVLGNGAAPVVGKVAIAQSANWSPANYQLTWTPTGAWMNASGDTGYTWGHYEGQSKDANGNPVNTSGRYITVWGKQPDGSWKVELEASANEPAESGNCCKLPGPGK
jgi:ketosteroid isomerase-like protein